MGEHRDEVPGRLACTRPRSSTSCPTARSCKLEEGVEGLVHISEMSLDASASTTRARWSTPGQKVEVKVLEINKDKQEISPRHEAGRGEPLGARRREVPAGHGHRGQGPQHRQLRRVRRDRGRHRRPAARLATCRGPRRSATPPRCSRRATASRRSCSTSIRRSSASRWASSRCTEDPWINAIPTHYRPGMVVQGHVTKIANFGVFVELEAGPGRPAAHLRDLRPEGREARGRASRSARRSTSRSSASTATSGRSACRSSVPSGATPTARAATEPARRSRRRRATDAAKPVKKKPSRGGMDDHGATGHRQDQVLIKGEQEALASWPFQKPEAHVQSNVGFFRQGGNRMFRRATSPADDARSASLVDQLSTVPRT